MSSEGKRTFEFKVGGKDVNYLLGEDLDLSNIRSFFTDKYQVCKIWPSKRHVLGLLEEKGRTFFLKVSKSEGISEMTKNEEFWNNLCQDQDLALNVPISRESGFYEDTFFYLITDYFDGEMLATPEGEGAQRLTRNMNKVIEMSEEIQKIKIDSFPRDHYLLYEGLEDHVKRTIVRTQGYCLDFSEYNPELAGKYSVTDLLKVVEENAGLLEKRPRHGDFAPWHIFVLENGSLGLIDGEHAMAYGVENYDICYFIQRVFSAMCQPEIAKKYFTELLKRGYNKDKLKVVLASRGVGGYLDESLKPNPNYSIHNQFRDWVLSI
jgi:hypothetical protein